MSKDNVVNLFKEKTKIKESPDVIISRFHEKLDEVMGEFNLLSVKEKYDVMQSLIEMNRSLFKMYMDLRGVHNFNVEEIIKGDDE